MASSDLSAKASQDPPGETAIVAGASSGVGKPVVPVREPGDE
jgi:hypothetical protein